VEKINDISATLTWNNGISSELSEISENNFRQMSKIRVGFPNCYLFELTPYESGDIIFCIAEVLKPAICVSRCTSTREKTNEVAESR